MAKIKSERTGTLNKMTVIKLVVLVVVPLLFTATFVKASYAVYQNHSAPEDGASIKSIAFALGLLVSYIVFVTIWQRRVFAPMAFAVAAVLCELAMILYVLIDWFGRM